MATKLLIPFVYCLVNAVCLLNFHENHFSRDSRTALQTLAQSPGWTQNWSNNISLRKILSRIVTIQELEVENFFRRDLPCDNSRRGYVCSTDSNSEKFSSTRTRVQMEESNTQISAKIQKKKTIYSTKTTMQ